VAAVVVGEVEAVVVAAVAGVTAQPEQPAEQAQPSPVERETQLWSGYW